MSVRLAGQSAVGIPAPLAHTHSHHPHSGTPHPGRYGAKPLAQISSCRTAHPHGTPVQPHTCQEDLTVNRMAPRVHLIAAESSARVARCCRFKQPQPLPSCTFLLKRTPERRQNLSRMTLFKWHRSLCVYRCAAVVTTTTTATVLSLGNSSGYHRNFCD